ncbi:MAG: DNA gyrase/topoisomerase IV subunit A [Flavobacteriales bacterium]|nr:DNA gyrase/topoisomerase IV subunit A [Flavobacteriales bacterium]
MEETHELSENQGWTPSNDEHERPLRGMYKEWFLDYASYVILERAVPTIEDGLKPVQRRILHSMKEMDDGRYNKVANIIGHTMKYHPHGDAAIGDAMVNLGQKELLIDTQGNWGDPRTGDPAAAPRYIEARLTKFALDVAFNKQTTLWQKSYDGRNNEPINLPIKFPLLLAQGVEGIAVGLSTRILPHNFIELIKGSIDVLKGKSTDLKPDFPFGGLADFSDYSGGARGGKVKVRARIETRDKRTLIIKEIPYGTTTASVIDSIIKANDKGTIKIKKVIDNTAKDLEIEVQVAPGVSVDKTIDALFAFTQCEVSISPNACIIIDGKPHFLDVNEILRLSTHNTVDLLRQELEIRKGELEEKWHFSSLEKIFIEERIYRDIEECETWEAIIETIDKGLDPYKKLLRREVTTDDITRLTEIRIKRISRFDSFKADELIKGIEDELAQVEHHLANLTEYAIDYFKELLKKYGKGKERRTEERPFGKVEASVVAVANQKLYANFEEGFVGTSLRKDEFICDCSDLDDVIVIRRDGKYQVSKVSQKAFFGKDIVHVDVWRKGDDRKVYNVVYLDGKSGKAMVKRFSVTSITRDKEYDLTAGTPGSKILYFSANPNGEAEIITVNLHGLARARVKIFDYNFAELAIKGRSSKGNTLTKYRIRKIDLKEKGRSTIGGRDIYYEPAIGRLNIEERGELLGNFQTDDLLLIIYKNGMYELCDHELTRHFEPSDVALITKFNPKRPITCIHYDHKHGDHFVKRFLIETSTLDKKFQFIGEGRKDQMVLATLQKEPIIRLTTKNKKNEVKVEELNLAEFIDVKGWKAIGNKLTYDEFVKFQLISEETDLEDEEDDMEDEELEGEDDNGDDAQGDLEDHGIENDEGTDDDETDTTVELKPKNAPPIDPKQLNLL